MAMSGPACRSGMKGDSPTELCERWCIETYGWDGHEHDTVSEHCRWCKCSACMFCPARGPSAAVRAQWPARGAERLVVRGARLLLPGDSGGDDENSAGGGGGDGGDGAVLRGVNMQFRMGSRYDRPKQWDAALERHLPRANLVRMVALHWGDSSKAYDCRSRDAASSYLRKDCWAYLDRIVQWAAGRGLWTILTARGAGIAGGGEAAAGGGVAEEGAGSLVEVLGDLFGTDVESIVLREHFVTMWAAVARRYASTPRIAAYELLSEPRAPEDLQDAVWRFYAEACAAVRANDPRTPCLVGAPRFYNRANLHTPLPPPGALTVPVAASGSGGGGGGAASTTTMREFDAESSAALLRDGVIYAFNLFSPLPFVHLRAAAFPGDAPCCEVHDKTRVQSCGAPDEEGCSAPVHMDRKMLEQELAAVLDFRRRHSVPIFCDQWGSEQPDVSHEGGEAGGSPTRGRAAWAEATLGLFEKHGVPWAYWMWRSEARPAAALEEDGDDDGRKDGEAEEGLMFSTSARAVVTKSVSSRGFGLLKVAPAEARAGPSAAIEDNEILEVMARSLGASPPPPRPPPAPSPSPRPPARPALDAAWVAGLWVDDDFGGDVSFTLALEPASSASSWQVLRARSSNPKRSGWDVVRGSVRGGTVRLWNLEGEAKEVAAGGLQIEWSNGVLWHQRRDGRAEGQGRTEGSARAEPTRLDTPPDESQAVARAAVPAHQPGPVASHPAAHPKSAGSRSPAAVAEPAKPAAGHAAVAMPTPTLPTATPSESDAKDADQEPPAVSMALQRVQAAAQSQVAIETSPAAVTTNTTHAPPNYTNPALRGAIVGLGVLSLMVANLVVVAATCACFRVANRCLSWIVAPCRGGAASVEADQLPRQRTHLGGTYETASLGPGVDEEAVGPKGDAQGDVDGEMF